MRKYNFRLKNGREWTAEKPKKKEIEDFEFSFNNVLEKEGFSEVILEEELIVLEKEEETLIL